MFKVELELEAQEFVEGLLVGRVVSQKVDKEVVLVQLALEALQDDVEDTVGVEVEVADDGLDHLEHLPRAGFGRHVRLVQLGDQLGVPFGLLPKQVVLLLLVAEYKNSILVDAPWISPSCFI